MKKFNKIIITNPEKFLSKIKIQNETGCWIFSGAIDKDGYRICHDKKPYKSHRYSFELFNGPLSEYMVIDHMCRNRACCNPDHLRDVTPTVNAKENRINMLIDYCKKGHKLTEENKSKHKGNGGFVTVCKECNRIKNKKARSNEETREKRIARRRELRLLNIEKIRERDRLAKRKAYALKKELKNG